MFKVSIFTLCCNVSLVNFEDVVSGWEAIQCFTSNVTFFFSFNPSIPIPDKKKKINLNFLFLRSGVTKSFIKALMTKKCKHKNLTFILIQISEMHGVGGSIHSFLRIIL